MFFWVVIFITLETSEMQYSYLQICLKLAKISPFLYRF
jgi:hypothetical protein